MNSICFTAFVSEILLLTCLFCQTMLHEDWQSRLIVMVLKCKVFCFGNCITTVGLRSTKSYSNDRNYFLWTSQYSKLQLSSMTFNFYLFIWTADEINRTRGITNLSTLLLRWQIWKNSWRRRNFHVNVYTDYSVIWCESIDHC